VPLLDRIDLQAVVTAARLPSSKMIPAVQAVRSLLALKLIGTERKSHVMDLVTDQAIALFAGLNVVPKRSYLAAYSSRIDHKVCLRFMEAWLDQVEPASLPHGASFDLDFHSVPANSAQEPLEKHYVSSRSRSQKGILVFLARDAEQRVLRYANAGVTKGEQADEILEFVRCWKKHTGKAPAELVFDSQLTTYQKLSELNREGICFITLRRRYPPNTPIAKVPPFSPTNTPSLIPPGRSILLPATSRSDRSREPPVRNRRRRVCDPHFLRQHARVGVKNGVCNVITCVGKVCDTTESGTDAESTGVGGKSYGPVGRTPGECVETLAVAAGLTTDLPV